jgi:cyclopropane fatty-acyl-phospholipid synthase-like methyltransferase
MRMDQMPNPEWYKDWFDSPYYHKLYFNHDEIEAHAFIDRLLDKLELQADDRVMDLACGKGRYSQYLAQKALSEVVGVDLSSQSIEYARQFENEKLSFFRHDMRLPFRINYFDYIFSFFTSFGYFERERDDFNTLRSITQGLKPQGVFVLDFFNSESVKKTLVPYAEKTVEDIVFRLQKQIIGNRVVKTIRFMTHGQPYFFQESVRLFTLAELEKLGSQAGLELRAAFGDYQLNPFQVDSSPRLILCFHKRQS